jgi:predicted Zn-ribbon and HTH transcriptional regulator
MSDEKWMTHRELIKKQLKIPGIELNLELIHTEFEYPNKASLIEDLKKVALSLKAEGYRIRIIPATCIACGYVFKDKSEDIKIPSRCPKCKNERINWPKLALK